MFNRCCKLITCRQIIHDRPPQTHREGCKGSTENWLAIEQSTVEISPVQRQCHCRWYGMCVFRIQLWMLSLYRSAFNSSR